MATQTDYLRARDEELLQDIATLELISRDIEAYRKGPKEVKIKAAPKYVTGVTKSQGDEEYASNIRAFGSKQLARAFGMNMGMSAVQQDVLNDLEAKFGKGEGVREYVDLATQVICHLIIQAATHSEDGATAKAALPFIKRYIMQEMKRDNGTITKMLKSLNEIDGSTTTDPAVGDVTEAIKVIKGKVYRYLRPLNLTHIQRVEAKFSPRIRSRDDMLAYIANEQAQTAAIRHMVKHPLPADVLAVDGGSATAVGDVDALKAVFEKYPGKDITATFKYYEAAVRENLDLNLGIQVGDVKAGLDAAANLLVEAGQNLKYTPVDADIQRKIRSEFNGFASRLKKIDPKSSLADEKLVRLMADIAVALGAYKDVGGTVTLEKLANSALEGNADALEFAKTAISRESHRFTQTDLRYLDAMSEICPKDIDNESFGRAEPMFHDAHDNIVGAFLNMGYALKNLVPLGRVESDRPQGIAAGTLKPTQQFANMVAEAINKFNKETTDAARIAKVKADETVLKKALVEVYENLLGARLLDLTVESEVTAGSDPDIGVAKVNPFLNDLTFDVATGKSSWGVPPSRLSQIASGTAPTFKTSGLEQAIIDIVNRNGRSLKAKERRATRDYAIVSAQLLSDILATLRAQAENTNIAVQTRSNPALSKMQMAGYGAGSLVGLHALSAAGNAALQPASGSMTAHAIDYLPSLGAVAYGLIKAQRGEKDLGYSLAGGAAAHILARYFYTNFPALRFGDSVVAKAFQAPTNGLAHLISDQSMAASALTPASVADVRGKELGEYLVNIVNANSDENISYIARQLCNSGLTALGKGVYAEGDGEGAGLQFKVVNAPAREDAKACCLVACALTRLKCVIDLFGRKAALASVLANGDVVCFASSVTIEGNTINLKSATLDNAKTECKARVQACRERMAKILNVKDADLSGFILEPGYNMDVYSGEDQVSYLQPAPHVTAQPGMVQLENAISRARKLGPQELLQEGIEDLQDVAIIRATPKTARMIEDAGMGTSLGRSRTNPGNELVALEVMGANGLWPVAPERQQSVPQGALNYAKIGHAPDVTVSSEGLFNRGVFTPRYGR